MYLRVSFVNGIMRTSVDLGGIWIERWTVVGGMSGGLEGLYEMLLSRSAIIPFGRKGQYPYLEY